MVGAVLDRAFQESQLLHRSVDRICPRKHQAGGSEQREQAHHYGDPDQQLPEHAQPPTVWCLNRRGSRRSGDRLDQAEPVAVRVGGGDEALAAARDDHRVSGGDACGGSGGARALRRTDGQVVVQIRAGWLTQSVAGTVELMDYFLSLGSLKRHCLHASALGRCG